MKALVFDKELNFVTDYPKPVPQKGEALIKVTHAGICNTDIECITVGFYKCYYNIYGMKYNEDTDENEKFGKKIDNFSSIYVNTDDTVLVNGVKYKVDKTNGEMLSKFDQSNGNATFIKLIFQVKKY